MGWQTAACPANAPLHNKNTHHPQRALLDWSHTGVERTCPLAGTHRKRNCAVTGMPNNANQTHGAANKRGEGGNNQRQLLLSAAISCCSTNKAERVCEQLQSKQTRLMRGSRECSVLR